MVDIGRACSSPAASTRSWPSTCAAARKRWTADLAGSHPDPCPWLTVAPSADRLYCGNHFGVIEERYLDNGARTGVDRSPQLGASATCP